MLFLKEHIATQHYLHQRIYDKERQTKDAETIIDEIHKELCNWLGKKKCTDLFQQTLHDTYFNELDTVWDICYDLVASFKFLKQK